MDCFRVDASAILDEEVMRSVGRQRGTRSDNVGERQSRPRARYAKDRWLGGVAGAADAASLDNGTVA